MNPYIKRRIVKYHGASRTETEDSVAVEKKLRVFINGSEFLTLHCTPTMLPELLNGLLLTEGILSDKISVGDITQENDNEISVKISVPKESLTEKIGISRYLGGLAYKQENVFQMISDDFSLGHEDLRNMFSQFQQKSGLFRETGCFHSAALSDGKDILVFAEDIGRHNTVDKAIGYAILNDIPFRGKIMLVSCRISSEIISKCACRQIPMIASRAAPTHLAIEIAEKSGMTLIGFARGESFNIYSNPQRVLSAVSS